MTNENKTEDDLCRHCDCTGTTQPGTVTGKDHHDNGGHVVPLRRLRQRRVCGPIGRPLMAECQFPLA